MKSVDDNLLKQEILSTALDISWTIAIWHDRYEKDASINIFYNAKWKNARVKSMLFLAQTLDIIDQAEFDDYSKDINSIGAMLYKYIGAMTGKKETV